MRIGGADHALACCCALTPSPRFLARPTVFDYGNARVGFAKAA